MEQGWVILFTTDNIPEAEMVKALLNENEILAVSLNKQGSPYVIGEIEVYVKNEDALQAKQVISKHQRN